MLAAVRASRDGLASSEAARRLAEVGPNSLPEPQIPTLFAVYLRQFRNPLVYILTGAALLSVAVGDWLDATFIGFVLVLNAALGAWQEYAAERSAAALRQLVTPTAQAVRDGEIRTVPARELVPGDVVRLESGMRVPADLRLLESTGLEVDESLLTGESIPVTKNHMATVLASAPLAERSTLVHAGTAISRGRGMGVIVATGPNTELGRLAAQLVERESTRAPLMVRIEGVTRRIGQAALFLSVLLVGLGVVRGMPWLEIVLLAVALAVSAVPEGMPIAVTMAMAVGVRRMAARNVIVRRLAAIEALGSCTVVLVDKTGTLTVNQLAVREVWVAGGDVASRGALVEAAVVACEDHAEAGSGSVFGGDPVDAALLVWARELGADPEAIVRSWPVLWRHPFESERQYAAVAVESDVGRQVFVKGAPERLLALCTFPTAVDQDAAEGAALGLAQGGMKVLALASGALVVPGDPGALTVPLTLLGFVGLQDPLRPEAHEAVAAAQRAGVRVVMVTGDHPATALALAREAGLAHSERDVVTGADWTAAVASGQGPPTAKAAAVFARMGPQQKSEVVEALIAAGEQVAVTGDGANDAPALHAAHIGIAMGQAGTDVAREAADLLLTNDNLASLVAGVEEGRVAYSNIRKVVYLLISTALAEVALIFLALLAGLPSPLTAVQLLWMNLVTEGIQAQGLAFEPAEGDEMHRPPRDPREPLIDRGMVERILLAALVMAGVSFGWFALRLQAGEDLAAARNTTLLLMVLCHNLQIGNTRSEVRSALTMNPLKSPVSLWGTVAALGVHAWAMGNPWLQRALYLEPVGAGVWLTLLGLASIMILALELYKLDRRRRQLG